jgi:hypothetical protein
MIDVSTPPTHDENSNPGSNSMDRIGRIIELALLALLVVVGFFQVYIYKRQAGIMDRQATIAEEQNKLTRINERASVFKREIDLIPTLNDKGDVVEWRIAPLWENSGATPTTDLKMIMDCPKGDFTFGQGEIDCPISDFRDKVGNYQRFLGPHQRSHDEGTCEAQTPAQIAAIPNHRFFMWAYARYTDVFGGGHKTRFCQGIILSGNPYKVGGLAAESVIAHGGNCTDEVCDEQDRQAENKQK